MDQLTVSQVFMLFSLNNKGKFPSLTIEPAAAACLMAADIIDLVMAGCVCVNKRKVEVTAPLSGEHKDLQFIYDILNEKKSMKLEKVVSDYCYGFSSKKIRELIRITGVVLADKNCVIIEPGKKNGTKSLFIPNKDSVDEAVQKMRAEVLGNEALSEKMAAVIGLLYKRGMLKHYFSKYEKDIVKSRISEIKNTESYRIVKEILDCLDELIAMYTVAAT